MCVVYDICNVGRVGNVWSLIDVWYVPSAFSKTNQNNRSTKLKHKTSAEHVFVNGFRLSARDCAVAALGGRSFDARAPLVAEAFSFVAQPNRNHINMLRENVIVIGEFCKAGQPSCIIAGFLAVCACAIHGDVRRTLEMRVGPHGKCTFVFQAHVATRWSRVAHILAVAFTCNVFGSFVAAH